MARARNLRSFDSRGQQQLLLLPLFMSHFKQAAGSSGQNVACVCTGCTRDGRHCCCKRKINQLPCTAQGRHRSACTVAGPTVGRTCCDIQRRNLCGAAERALFDYRRRAVWMQLEVTGGHLPFLDLPPATQTMLASHMMASWRQCDVALG